MAQKDPLVEYRNEGSIMFDELISAIHEEVVTLLFHAEVTADDGSAAQLQDQPGTNGGNGALSYEHQSLAGADAILAAGGTSTAAGAMAMSGGGSVSTPVAPKPKVNSELENIGRNDPCWCGSGKKFKKCHGESGGVAAASGSSEMQKLSTVIVAFVVLCVVAVSSAWMLTQTAYALRYAHLYYRDHGQGVGGLEFPGGGRPSYLDFAYFSFTVGMCFQVSDVTISTRQMRRAVLGHSLLSFLYNTAILATAINLAIGVFS